jgi:hypothetical protein
MEMVLKEYASHITYIVIFTAGSFIVGLFEFKTKLWPVVGIPSVFH